MSRDKEAPKHLTWHQLVQPPKKSEPKQRSGAFYDAMRELPTPESLAVTEFPEDYRGGRSPRPSSVYSNDLHLRSGAAWSARRERLHPQRVAKRNAARKAKQDQARRNAAALALMAGRPDVASRLIEDGAA